MTIIPYDHLWFRFIRVFVVRIKTRKLNTVVKTRRLFTSPKNTVSRRSRLFFNDINNDNNNKQKILYVAYPRFSPKEKHISRATVEHCLSGRCLIHIGYTSAGYAEVFV